MEANDSKVSAVYVSWPTMNNALEQLSQGVPPSRIDRSVFQECLGVCRTSYSLA